MSEEQAEYDTSTPLCEFNSAPWEAERLDDPDAIGGPGTAAVWASDGDLVASVTAGIGGARMERGIDRAELIAAAGTAAHEAAEMGYDGQKAVEALPNGLDAARRAILDLQDAHTDGPPEDTAEAAAQGAAHRLKAFMAEAGADESMIPRDASVALKSAEGIGGE